MIIDILYFIGGSLLAAFAKFLSLISFVIPANVFSFIPWALSQMQYFAGVVDLPNFYFVVLTMISFELFWLLFLLAWYIIGFFRSLISRGGGH